LAEDLVQEAQLRAIRAAPALRDEERLIPWFYRILRNAIIDHHRRRGMTSRGPGGQETDLEALMTEDSVDKGEICACLAELLGDLKPGYREVIERIDLDGESAERVALDLGIERNNLKVRRHRARKALRKKLEEACGVCAEHHCLDCSCRD
jgi:RNA polymerase sigma-70 factor (ECF subfamily)